MCIFIKFVLCLSTFFFKNSNLGQHNYTFNHKTDRHIRKSYVNHVVFVAKDGENKLIYTRENYIKKTAKINLSIQEKTI